MKARLPCVQHEGNVLIGFMNTIGLGPEGGRGTGGGHNHARNMYY